MSAHHAIETILLDLGGVQIHVDYHASARAFKALGFEEFDALYSQAKQDQLFDGFEIGALSPAQFRDRIRQLFRQDLTDREIDACWNAMLGSVPMERIDLIDLLKQRYQVLLLSNTNAIHVPAFSEIIRKENGIANFKGLFHGAYYSCEMGLSKPDATALMHVMERHGAKAERTLFIDDSLHRMSVART